MSLLCNGPEFLELDSEDNFDGGASDRLILSLAHDDHPTNRVTMEAEKRIRREIANSNERRRMQSINAGFQSLRTLLPRHEGEKLSKAAILQQTAEYIYSLEQEKTRLLSQNCQLKRLLNRREGGDGPPKKRKAVDEAPSADEADEAASELLAPPTATALPALGVERLADETRDLRLALERERRLRTLLEERVRSPPLFEPEALALYADGERLASPPAPLAPPAPREILERIVPVERPPPAEAPAPPPLPPSRSPSPAGRAPPLLEAAIKAEPKVEVEVLPDARCASPSRLYLASTSRQNLETIVEAIRHLEGDHLFGEERDAPLALTVKPESEAAAAAARQRLLRVEVEPFLRFEAAARRQSRPGVIVVKQS